MDPVQITWIIVIAAIVIVAIIVAAALTRRRSEAHKQRQRERAEEMRAEAERRELDVREHEAKGHEAQAQAEKAEVEAARLRQQAEDRREATREDREKIVAQRRKADELDPNVGDGARDSGRRPDAHPGGASHGTRGSYGGAREGTTDRPRDDRSGDGRHVAADDAPADAEGRPAPGAERGDSADR